MGFLPVQATRSMDRDWFGGHTGRVSQGAAAIEWAALQAMHVFKTGVTSAIFGVMVEVPPPKTCMRL
ncbi:MAG: hypothetical protein ACQEVT_14410 [Pseudomonadota bacterium]|uniref:hypothetical protein n=1 Tax=Roseovarius TaxID=74030 RepID=UPI0022A8C89D|nr:hypothetical protein [Roseovarius sp. EGI FJ00037]MCZ0813830.1 hypothetical protein [Roseovarius sp. EGI FJ00037]